MKVGEKCPTPGPGAMPELRTGRGALAQVAVHAGLDAPSVRVRAGALPQCGRDLGRLEAQPGQNDLRQTCKYTASSLPEQSVEAND